MTSVIELVIKCF